MKSYFKYNLKFFTFAFKNRLFRPLEYIVKSYQTIALLIRESPDVIWIQLPPNLLLHLAYIYKKLFKCNLIIIADCHNATFRKPWIDIPGTVFLLNYCDIILVHNNSVKEQALDNKIHEDKIYVLEDPPAIIKVANHEQKELFTSPWIVCPCSFNQDEPIPEILDAARLIPEITVVITGNINRAQRIHDLNNIPNNVKLTGFLSNKEFDLLICSADAVMGLTKLDGIQLSVANEALGANKPMILADTNTLTELFYQGAVYVDPLEPKSIAQGCRQAIERKTSLEKEVRELRQEKELNWFKQAEVIGKILTE